jgi:multidrug efflux pump subunit AcrB
MRRLIRAALDNPAVVVALFAALTLAGAMSFTSMPRREDPAVNPPFALIITALPGASAERVERLVTDPIEEAIDELEDIKRISSTSRTGVSVIELELFAGVDVLERWRTLRRLVAQAEEQLPDDATRPEIRAENLLDVGVMTIAVAGPASGDPALVTGEIERIARQVGDIVERVPGIARVSEQGFAEPEVTVDVDLRALAVRRVPFTRVVGALRASNVRLPGGDLAVSGSRYPVETSGAFESVAQVEQTVVDVSPTGSPVTVADLAQVAQGRTEARERVRFRGRPAVLLTPFMQDGQSVTDLGRELRALVADRGSDLPDGYQLRIVSDQSRRVEQRIDKFSFNLLQGLALVIAITALALGLGGMVPVTVALPLSMVMGLAGMNAVGLELHQVSISALVLVIGMLVDNSIVITENVERHMRLGASPKQAAVEGAHEVWGSVLSSTLTTVVAFTPLAFMSDNTGEFIRALPIVVCLTLGSSYLVAMLVTPALAARLYRPRETIAARLERRVVPLFDRLLAGALRRPWVTLGIATAVLFGSLLSAGLLETEYFPKSENREFHIDITAPPGADLDTTEEGVLAVEGVLEQVPEVDAFTASIGRGFPRFYYNVFPRDADEAHAQVHVALAEDGRPTAEIIAELSSGLAHVPGVRIEPRELEQGPPVGAPVVVRLFGDRIPPIRSAAREVVELLDGAPGIAQVYDDYGADVPRVAVDVNRVRASRAGLAEAEIAQAVRLAVAGIEATTLRDADEEVSVIVRAAADQRGDFDGLATLYVDSQATGESVPLRQVAAVVPDFTLGSIRHRNLARTVTVRVWGQPGTSTAELERSVESAIAGYRTPAGVTLELGGETEHRSRSFESLGRLALIAILAVFVILVFQYRSLIKPLAILAALPLATIGAVLGLWALDSPLGFMAILGLVSLIGVVINDSIVLVEFIEIRRRRGDALDDAIREGVRIRLRPIAMTTITTIGGMVPLTFFGGSLWRPMGAVIIFGLLAATLLTLIVVPVLYRQLERARTVVGRIVRREPALAPEMTEG